MKQHEPVTEDTLLAYGRQHRGKALKDIPASYLVWMYEQGRNVPRRYTDWILEKIDLLEMAAKEEEGSKTNTKFRWRYD